MSILNEQDVINFYNSFANRQVRVGQNERHHSIFKYLLQKGLQKNHQILEIGCGIGTLTGLISKYLKNPGHITAIDISDENIRLAKKKYELSKNIEWICSNILVFNSSNKFDFIVLPDVLEHIPFIQYENLFVKLKFFLKESGIIFIHIPNPFYNEWIKINHPEQLQIIDQSVYLETIFGHIIQNNFYIHYLNNYKIWKTPEDYQIILLKNKPDTEKNIFTEQDAKFSISNRLKNNLKKYFQQHLNPNE